MGPVSLKSPLFIWMNLLLILLLTTNQHHHHNKPLLEIGWDLPGCDPSGEGHHQHPHNPPSAPEMVPNLPRIPNQTGIADTCTSDSKFTYGCCLPTSPEVPLQDHLLGRPINAFLSPSNKNRAQLEKHEFWVKGSQGSIPAGAIEGGQEADGQPLYVVRAELEGSLTPGKVNRLR